MNERSSVIVVHPVRSNVDVARLEIAVHDSLLMRGVERPRTLAARRNTPRRTAWVPERSGQRASVFGPVPAQGRARRSIPRCRRWNGDPIRVEGERRWLELERDLATERGVAREDLWHMPRAPRGGTISYGPKGERQRTAPWEGTALRALAHAGDEQSRRRPPPQSPPLAAAAVSSLGRPPSRAADRCR